MRSDKKSIISGALRSAVNMPIQGSAADIIKIAMIRADKIIEKFNAKLLLQIHDELVFEIDEDQYSDFALELKEVMENCVELKVPLKVNINKGSNWYEAH